MKLFHHQAAMTIPAPSSPRLPQPSIPTGQGTTAAMPATAPVSTEYLRSSVDALTPMQAKALAKNLSVSERYRLMRTIEQPETTSDAELLSISRKIDSAKNSSPSLTRASDLRIGLKTKAKAAALLPSGDAGPLNALSAQKTYAALRGRRVNLAPGKTGEDGLPLPTTAQVKRVLAQAQVDNKDARIDVAACLRQAGYTPQLSHCHFVDSDIFKNCTLDGMRFSACKFDWAHFSDAELRHTVFEDCKFLNTSFMHSTLEDCTFTDCRMREVMFIAAELRDTHFSRSDIVSSAFEDATIADSSFENVNLPGTHFLGAEVAHSIIKDSNLKDAVFFGTLEKFNMPAATKETANLEFVGAKNVAANRPTTVMPVFPEARGISVPKVFMKLDQSANTVPLRIGMQPQKVTKEQVNAEVETLLAEIGTLADKSTPVAQQLITLARENPNRYPAITDILKKARALSSTVNAICLPGGEDIPASLYGEENHEKNSWGGDYRRSILELALIDDAMKRGVPMMGICRGFQMSNVYFGAHLIQHIDGHAGVQKFELHDKENYIGLYGNVLRQPMSSTVYHHQAIPVESAATQRLETSVIYRDLVKVAELDRGATAILLQFHPEFHAADSGGSLTLAVTDYMLTKMMSSSNEDFWKILSDAANTHKNAKQMRKELVEVNPGEAAAT